MDRIGRALMENADSLGELLSREEGKTRPEGRGEVYRAGQFLPIILRLRSCGKSVIRPTRFVQVSRLISVSKDRRAWLRLSVHGIPDGDGCVEDCAALAFVDAVVHDLLIKHTASAVALTEIVAQQEIPLGLFNLLMGSGSGVGDALTAHQSVDAVSFTGSVDVGRTVATQAASHFAKVQRARWAPRMRCWSWTTPTSSLGGTKRWQEWSIWRAPGQKVHCIKPSGSARQGTRFIRGSTPKAHAGLGGGSCARRNHADWAGVFTDTIKREHSIS